MRLIMGGGSGGDQCAGSFSSLTGCDDDESGAECGPDKNCSDSRD